MMVIAVLVLILGIPLITIRLNSELNRPSYNLVAYVGDFENLNLLTISNDLEILITDSAIYTMNPHLGPSTLDCSMRITVTNTGEDIIDDFEPVMGTLFTQDNEVIYSFWVAFYGRGVPIDKDPIQANSSIDLYCVDSGSYVLTDSEYDWILHLNFAYLRMMFSHDNESLILTSPLTRIMNAVE